MSEVSAAAAKAFIAMAPEHKVLMGFIQNQELVMLQCEFPLIGLIFQKGMEWKGWPCCSCATKIVHLGSP